MQGSEEYEPRPGAGGRAPAPGEAGPADGRGPAHRCANGIGGAAAQSPEAFLTPASELPGGRRRRRSALWEESGDPAFAGGASGPAAAEAADGPGRRRGGRERGRRQAGTERPGRGNPPPEESDPAARARDICLRLLTGTAKTRKQLADALRKREIPDDVAEQVLTRLEEVGLIDDAAFADAWVESRHAGRGLARRALAQELRTRGVAGELVEQAVAQVDAEDESVSARALVDRKLRATRGLERQARTRRLVGMLARRGYSEGLAYRVVREALAEESGEGGEHDEPGGW
ncbi:recombination regulator RecX [Kitasatospora sp. NPDC057223]|uniref:recombination regulator RecX n=1 Tax=Kitasatospora sp. NPDC057223 TaxID=3346055 RepID=UPI0036289090